MLSINDSDQLRGTRHGSRAKGGGGHYVFITRDLFSSRLRWRLTRTARTDSDQVEVLRAAPSCVVARGSYVDRACGYVV